MTATLSHLPAASASLEAPLAAFERFEKEHGKSSPPWLRTLRTSGISYFAELGFPTNDQEDWRFTNPAPLASFPFVPAPGQGEKRVTAADLAGFDLAGLEAHRLVFIDGRFEPELSRLLPRPPGGILGSLATAVRDHASLLESALGRTGRHETNALAALNTAFIQDGAFLYIPARLELEHPVHLLFVSSRPGTVNQPRVLLVARAQSRVQVIEDYVSLTPGGCFTNAVTEIMAGGGARVEHLKIQRENKAGLHTALIEGRQHRDSRVVSHSISFGGGLTRNQIQLRFEQEGCDSIMNGLYFASDRQVVDHHTLADHASPHCNSHEFYHGILGGSSRGVFNGRIIVRQDAQKTDAKQTNRNLLLSDEATVNTKPQLEIFADDVKCTHGATVGQLDEEALFYLRSRGIGAEEARAMLIHAFASDVLGRIGIEAARAGLEQILSERLAQPQAVTPTPLHHV